MDTPLFYRNEKISWRWENNLIIIYFSDKYWLLNESASLIFYYCERMNLSGLVEFFCRFKSLDKNHLFLVTSRFLRILLNEGIIVLKSGHDNKVRDNIILKNNFPDFSKPEMKIFDIGSIDHLSFNRPNSPLRVFFTINRECNLSCKSCYNLIKKNNDVKCNLNKVKSIIDRVKEAEVFEIILTGGEPFLNSYIFDTIDYILAKGIKVRINTNALLLTDEYITELKKRKDAILAVGIDGVSEKTNDFIRGEGNFKKVTRALEKLSLEDINIYINFTATHSNFADILKLKSFFRAFNVSRVLVNIFIITGRGKEYSKVLRLNKLEFGFLKFIDLFNKTNDRPLVTIITSCYAGHVEANIDFEGTFFFCELLNYPLGNVLEKNVKDIWNSPEILSLIDVDKFEFPCGSCFFKRRCRGSCRAEVFAATGNLYSGNPYCFKGKIIPKFLNHNLRKLTVEN